MNPQAIRDKVAIVGMGCCKFGENWDKSPEDMIVEAAFEAYEDAKIDNPQQQIEAVFCGSVYPSKGTAEVADALKLFGRPVSMTQNYIQHASGVRMEFPAAPEWNFPKQGRRLQLPEIVRCSAAIVPVG